jgi:hypothetical protein
LIATRTLACILSIDSTKTPTSPLDSDGSQHFIVCKKYVEEVGEQEVDADPIGTGPYTLAEH